MFALALLVHISRLISSVCARHSFSVPVNKSPDCRGCANKGLAMNECMHSVHLNTLFLGSNVHGPECVSSPDWVHRFTVSMHSDWQ